MPPLHSVLLFMAAGLALNITPGPDMLYIAARSTSEGRAAGVASALGIGAGTLVHITLVAAGLAALLRAVPTAYLAVKLAGGLYLIWLGIRALRRPDMDQAVEAPPPASRWVVFRQGIITNVLNPKVALFFVAFLPQFVDPARGSAALQVVALGILFDIQGTIVNLVVALAASGAAQRLTRYQGGRSVLERITGVVFLGLGARLLMSGGSK
jgi:threonine/homoserine/homoserine lactone efflux protein